MERFIDIDTVLQWLIKMAAADGVFSKADRKTILEFAETYELNAPALFKDAYIAATQIDIPTVIECSEPEMKGRMFEDFVVSLCSDKSRFKILKWAGDKIVGKIYGLDNLNPDLLIEHQLDKHLVQYMIECKYRSSWGKDGIDLSSQYVRYHFAAKDRNMELFIALGVGGTPSNPEVFYLIPGRMVKLDKKIDPDRFIKCLCPKDHEGFHNYINHYFYKRVFKTIR